jgi:hypothetical protein
VLSSFLDNIAAAMIGGTVAADGVQKRRVHVGYLAAIVAASNAGGSGSVIGDTTTTMMWIDGVSPLHVMHAYGGAVVALLVMATVASAQQTRYAPILAGPAAHAADRPRAPRHRGLRDGGGCGHQLPDEYPVRGARERFSLHGRGGRHRPVGLRAHPLAQLGSSTRRDQRQRHSFSPWSSPPR